MKFICRRAALLLMLGVTAVGVAACGSDDESSSTSTGTAAKSTSATKDNPATGSAVVLGVVAMDDQPEYTDGVKAAVEYLNKEGRGLLGHRIELKSCGSDASPQQDIKCANELVRSRAIAVVLGEDRSADSAFPIYQRAHVPVITPRVVTNQELVNPMAVALGPGIPAVLAGLADYARKKLAADNAVTVVAQGIPQGLLDQLVGGPLNAAGIKSEYVFFSHQSPNFNSTFAAAAQKKPDVVIADIDDNPDCIPAMNAMKAVGASFKVFQILCSDDTVIKAAGGLADGQLFYGPVDSVAGVESPDAQTFKHIVETYSAKNSTGFNTSLAVSAVMTIARVLKKQGGTDVTADSILSAFKDSKGLNIFMGPPLTCGIAKPFPALCTLAMRIFTVEGGRKKPITGYVSAPQYLGGKN
jgi:branched-chain amino acid transport system substrate-binding protein